MWQQTMLRLEPMPRGFHLITPRVRAALPDLAAVGVGLLHLFLQHTSASLCLNENADPTVRSDMEAYFSRSVPEQAPYFRHTLEGPDDMPAHIKAVLLGSSLTIPIASGDLALGTWQGIYLCEHRDRAGARSLIATVHGQGR